MSQEHARLIAASTFRDARGHFSTPWDRGVTGALFVPDSLHFSRNAVAGTLRGLHFQTPPHAQTKLVSCVQGAAFDVVVDLRPDSSDYRRWFSFSLTGGGDSLFVPAGFAHGFYTLEPETVISYLISGAYVPDAGRGLSWNDPSLGIPWPGLPTVLSERDASWPPLTR